MFEDPVFVARVKERFNDIYTNRQLLYDHIDSNAAVIKQKIYEDNKLWERVCSTTATEDEVKDAYQAKIDDLKNWIETRLNWLYTNCKNCGWITVPSQDIAL